MKVLLVEDSLIQIDWAKKIFANDELIVCKTGREFEKKIKEIDIIDLLVTDLFVPYWNEKDAPHFMRGLDAFVEGVKLLAKEKIKKLVLVSNYEHHVDIDPFEGYEEMILRSVFEVAETLKNTKIIFDTPVREYDFYYKEGEIIPQKEMKKFIERDYGVPFFEALKEGEIVLLKPYHLIRRWAAGEENK